VGFLPGVFLDDVGDRLTFFNILEARGSQGEHAAMARINIEECWWSDPRRMKLLLKIGFVADSAAVNMWRTAQEFWSHGRRMIPKDVFDNLEFASDLVGACLAEVKGDMVYVRGSSTYLDWAAEKRQAASAGGKKSAQRPRNAKGQLLKTSKQSPSSHQAEPKLSQASDSDSVSSSDSKSKSGKENLSEKLEKRPPKAAAKVEGVGEVIAFYCEQWRERYHGNPDVGSKGSGQVKTLVKDFGVEKAKRLIQAYLQMPDSLYVTRRHDLGTLLLNTNPVSHFIATGKVVTKEVLKKLESQTDEAQGTIEKPKGIAEILADNEASRLRVLTGGER
jgi:hypothetical protein